MKKESLAIEILEEIGRTKPIYKNPFRGKPIFEKVPIIEKDLAEKILELRKRLK